jgi:hypothetical protein
VKRGQRSSSKRQFISLPDTPSPSLHTPPFSLRPQYSHHLIILHRHHSAIIHSIPQCANESSSTRSRRATRQLNTTRHNNTTTHTPQWRTERPRPTLPSSAIACPTCTKCSVARLSRRSICSASTFTCAMLNAASTISISGTQHPHWPPEYTSQD